MNILLERWGYSMRLSRYLPWSIVRKCLAKYPNGITVTELMRKEPELSFDKYTTQAVMQTLRRMKCCGEVKREVKVVNPRKRFILVGTMANGDIIKGSTEIQRYCKLNRDEVLSVKCIQIETGENQVLFSLV